jgi:ABC-type multidrug transport system fused ATPase/permease subunit
VITAIGMLVIAVFIDWQLALLSIVVVPLLIHSTRVYARRVQPRIYEVRELEAASQSTLLEGLSMMRVIMAFGRERHEYGRWNELAQRANVARLQLTIRQTVYSLVVGTTTAAGTALIIGVGAMNVIERRLTLGELVVLLGYIASIYNPLTQISGTFSQVQQQLVNFESSLAILDTEPEVVEAPDATSIERTEGRVAYGGVSFTYPDIDYAIMRRPKAQLRDGESTQVSSVLPEKTPRRVREFFIAPGMLALYERTRALGLDIEELMTPRRDPALYDVSFEVEPGQHGALVGPTGAGKTTLVNLLMRFYDPTEGAILLDGVDIRKLKLTSLRDQISVVPQEPLLFGGTIGENIRYGKLGASDEEVVEAARAANIHDFIARLPNDYETVIGERGSQLSGGERQRISVARAFLKDSPIAILDEPTSSVDSETEAVILAALDRLMAGRTTFTIAHRLSTVRRADVILVLNEGRLVQQGTHEELIASGGLYRRLHDLQHGLAEADVSGDGRRREEISRPIDLMLIYADVLVAALHSLLRDGTPDDLVALVHALPERVETSGEWTLIGAVLATLRDDSDEPLRRFAARISERSRHVYRFAQGAEHLLRQRDVLRTISRDLRDGRGPGVEPLDADLVVREPWTQLAKVSPMAAEVVLERVPTPGAISPDMRRQRRLARAARA